MERSFRDLFKNVRVVALNVYRFEINAKNTNTENSTLKVAYEGKTLWWMDQSFNSLQSACVPASVGFTLGVAIKKKGLCTIPIIEFKVEKL